MPAPRFLNSYNSVRLYDATKGMVLLRLGVVAEL